MAKLFFRYGTMEASKSANLLMTAFNYKQKNIPILLWKPSKDTRQKGIIYSRVELKQKCSLIKENENLIKKLENENINDNVKVILIDEAQFLTKKQVEELLDIVVLKNIDIMCYGLKIGYKLNGFEGSKELLTLAHDIQEIKTICKCGKKATTHLLKQNGKYVFDGEDIIIGDKEFQSVCYECYYKELSKEVKESEKFVKNILDK